VALLLGRDTGAIDDPRIDPAFETPDGATPVTGRTANAPGFLDGGTSFALYPARRRPAHVAPLLGLRSGSPIEDHARTLSTSDVAAAVQLKLVAPSEAPAVARERSVAPALIGVDSPAPPAPFSRAYLAGRFGPNETTWIIAANEPRAFETGSLIYASAEPSTPLGAIGVIVGHDDKGARALIGRSPVAPGDIAVVRDAGGAIRVRLVEEAKGA
jgi:hypothetical protein